MKATNYAALIALTVVSATSCKTVYPGQVGVKIIKGKIQPGILTQGRHYYNPLTSKIYKFSTLITEYSAIMRPPTKEGLEIKMDLTLLYHIDPAAAPNIYSKVGTDYANKIVVNNFMAIVREYSMTYTAIDLLGERETIEKNIETKLNNDVSPYGIILDDVLVKDIDMPKEVLQAIKDKARAEQRAKQVTIELATKREEDDFDIETKRKEATFDIEKQKDKAEQMQIEANAIREYQKTINETLTENVLKYKSIDMTKDLITSPNAKVIIVDGKTAMINAISDH